MSSGFWCWSGCGSSMSAPLTTATHPCRLAIVRTVVVPCLRTGQASMSQAASLYDSMSVLAVLAALVRRGQLSQDVFDTVADAIGGLVATDLRVLASCGVIGSAFLAVRRDEGLVKLPPDSVPEVRCR